jgi:hypothetical protein
VNGSAVLARGQVMEYANLDETDPIVPIAVEDVYEKVHSFEIKVYGRDIVNDLRQLGKIDL